jgi:uncharacterized protein YcsI (UPF0317 family)
VVNTDGPFENLQPPKITKDAAMSRGFEPAGKENMDFNVQEPMTTPKPSQRHIRTERADIEFETDMDSEPSGQVHRDHEVRGSMWHGSPSRHYNHIVSLFTSTHTLPIIWSWLA